MSCELVVALLDSFSFATCSASDFGQYKRTSWLRLGVYRQVILLATSIGSKEQHIGYAIIGDKGPALVEPMPRRQCAILDKEPTLVELRTIGHAILNNKRHWRSPSH
ncbi:hypothetical protein B0O80DRAFT_248539 [Mortierella sp. GBAus27b]|nr:hypothetical protein B0O80DRAFT_248539 [Mortierella sp. GBAus27b]